MFDQIKELVQKQLAGSPEVAALPDDQKEQVHNEVASQIQNGLASQAVASGGVGGLLSQLGGTLSSGNNSIVNAIEGGVVSSLGNKFGLSPAVTGAIAASLPGLLQKFAHKANDPNDNSLTPDSITKSLSGLGGGNLGGMLGGLFGGK